MTQILSPIIPCERSRAIQRSERKRSPFYDLAKHALMWGVQDLGVDRPDVSLCERNFDLWRAHYKDKFMVLGKEDKRLFMRSVSRFDDPYRDVLKRRMRDYRMVNWTLKFEFTLDPKKFLGLYDEFVFLPKLWNIIRIWIERNYGKFDFLRILEITKNNRPHFHVLVVFRDEKMNRYFRTMSKRDKSKRFQGFYEKLKDVSLRNNGGWVWVRTVQGNLRIINYVMKYVNKSLSLVNKAYSALLFASNRRIFAVSRGLRYFDGRKPRISQGYSYKGCVPASELRRFCAEKEISFGFRVEIEICNEYFYDFPNLFIDYYKDEGSE